MTAADRFRRLPPDDRHVLELIALEPPARDSKSFQDDIVEILIFAETGIAFILRVGGLLARGLGIGQIDELVAAEVRIDRDGKQPSLLVILDLGHTAERIGEFSLGINAQIAGLLCDQQPAIRQKRHRPRIIQRCEAFDFRVGPRKSHDLGVGPWKSDKLRAAGNPNREKRDDKRENCAETASEMHAVNLRGTGKTPRNGSCSAYLFKGLDHPGTFPSAQRFFLRDASQGVLA